MQNNLAQTTQAAQVAAEPELRDWRGKPIEVGTKMVYPGRRGSSIWVTEGEVVEIKSEEDWRGEARPVLMVRRLRATHFFDDEARPVVKLFNLGEVTVVC